MTADTTRRYIGPTMAECLEPATWMTKVGTVPPRTGPGRTSGPPIYLREEATRDYVMRAGETKTEFIDYHNPRRRYSDVGFDRLKRPFSDHPRLSDLFAQQAFSSRVDELTYAPGEVARIITVDGDRSFNMHVPALLKPLSYKPTEADWQPWLGYLDHLFPSADERGHVQRYLATMYARPGIRMLYALLLASGMQGVGKTTLGLISEVQVGRRNCSTPTAQQVVNSSFNSWVACKRLVVVNEIYEEGNWAAYNKLKTYITEPFIRVNEKHLAEYSVPNCAQFMLFSNSEAPLQLEEHDRRIFAPTVTEAKHPPGQPAFWRDFYIWLEGDGHSIIRHWAEAFVAKHGAARSGDAAPMTKRKQQMIEASRSPNERMARDLADAALAQAENGSPVALVDWEVCAWLAGHNGHAVKPQLLHRWLAAAGLHLSDERMKAAGRMGKVAATIPITGKLWTELREYHQRPSDLDGM